MSVSSERKKKRMIFARLCQCVFLREARLPSESLLLNVRSSLWEEFIFSSTNTMEHYVLIQAVLLSGETQRVGVRGKFSTKVIAML